MMRMILQIIKVIIPEIFEKQCPYEMTMNVINFRVPKTYALILPEALYKFKLSMKYPTKFRQV